MMAFSGGERSRGRHVGSCGWGENSANLARNGRQSGELCQPPAVGQSGPDWPTDVRSIRKNEKNGLAGGCVLHGRTAACQEVFFECLEHRSAILAQIGRRPAVNIAPPTVGHFVPNWPSFRIESGRPGTGAKGRRPFWPRMAEAFSSQSPVRWACGLMAKALNSEFNWKIQSGGQIPLSSNE